MAGSDELPVMGASGFAARFGAVDSEQPENWIETTATIAPHQRKFLFIIPQRTDVAADLFVTGAEGFKAPGPAHDRFFWNQRESGPG
jgi:hypothetical protein